MLTLVLRGVRVRYLILEKAIRLTAESVLTAIPSVTAVGSTIGVTLLSRTAASVHVTVRNRAGETAPDSLAQTIASEIQARTGCRSEVKVEMVPVQTYSTL
jgi:hypothetical protein